MATYSSQDEISLVRHINVSDKELAKQVDLEARMVTEFLNMANCKQGSIYIWSC
jgi:hypothetical protein